MTIIGMVGNALKVIIAAVVVWLVISMALIVTSIGLMKAWGVL